MYSNRLYICEKKIRSLSYFNTKNLSILQLIFEIWSLFESPKIQIQMKNHENLDSNVNVEGNNSNHVSTDNSTKLTEKRNIHIGSNRVLNLLYNSKTDLSEENSPLLVATTA